MLTIGFPAAAFDTNCYVLAPAAGEECLVVDPGIGVEETLREVFAEHRLRPAAVLLTHGHLDHVYAVTPVCGSGTAAYVHTDDRYRLADPLAGLDPGFLWMVESQFGQRATWQEPERVVEVTDRQRLELAGLVLEVRHAPGHTEGSVLFTLDEVPDGLRADEPIDRTVVSGDVLFAGSIGRTDLPGGSTAAMQRSLRQVVLPLPDSSLVLTGHGPATTIRRERASNPYLLELTA
ncbi:MAG TPA: MBL fold metallo-hydrolase [Dermatophilaceae bacterium]|nr:MBL fold metallo-hydrolase [Dermatophilaceae bacterium]